MWFWRNKKRKKQGEMRMYKNDRRMFERFVVQCPAELKPVNGQVSTAAKCCDVSATGTCLLTEQKLVPNASFELCMSFPDKHAPFRSIARVVWSNQVRQDKWRCGMEFEQADFMGLRRIFDVFAKKRYTFLESCRKGWIKALTFAGSYVKISLIIKNFSKSAR